MGNLHSYYGDVSASAATGSSPFSPSPSSSSSPSHAAVQCWEHRLDQVSFRSLYVHHQLKAVSFTHPSALPATRRSSASSTSSSSPSSAPPLDLLFADLPPPAYSHGVRRELLFLLAQSSPFLSPHSSAFLQLTSASHARLSRQLHELVFHHVNLSLVHSLSGLEQLQRSVQQQRSAQLSFAYHLLLPTASAEEREEHTAVARSHLKQIASRTQGKAGRKLLSSAVLDALERAGGVGSLYGVCEERVVRELSSGLLAASSEQLMKDELTLLIRSSLSLCTHTLSCLHALHVLLHLSTALRLYGDMRLPMFSALTRFNHELLPAVLRLCREGSAEERAWKATVICRMQDAFALLTSNDREKERAKDREKENVAFSFAIAFLSLHLAIMAETYAAHHIAAQTSVSGQCAAVPRYALFTAPLVVDLSPDSAALQADLLHTLVSLRAEPQLPQSFKAMFSHVRSLFPPSTLHPNSVQTVRLLLPLLSSLLATPSSILCRQFRYGADGPFFECIEEWQERRDILLLLGFRIVDRKRGKAEESKEGRGEQQRGDVVDTCGEREWFVDEQQLDLPLLRYAVQQLSRFNAAFYDQRPTPSPLDSLAASSPLSTSILSHLSLLRVHFLTAKTNRVAPSLLTRPELLCANRLQLLPALVELLTALIGRDETEWNHSDADRLLEREKACELLCLLFSLLPSCAQLRVLHVSLVSTPFRLHLLQLLEVEPMAFSLFPSQHSPASAPSTSTVWERLSKGVWKEQSTASLLTEPDVVAFLVEQHQHGSFSMTTTTPRRMSGKVRAAYDWLLKATAASAGEEATAALSSTGEVAAAPSAAFSQPSSSTSSGEEKKEGGQSSPPPSPPLLTTMPSPPLLSFTRSISSFFSIDAVEVSDFYSFLDLTFHYLTAATTPPSTREDLQLLLLHLQRCLTTRTLIPLNSYDRTHTPLLLASYATSLTHHTNEFIAGLRQQHTNATTTATHAQPMTSLTPSFPASVTRPLSFEEELHASPFAFLLSSMLAPIAFLASLPRLSLPLDEQLLTSLHQLLSHLGGYAGLDDDSGLRAVVEREEADSGAEPPPYTCLAERLAVSSPLLDAVLSPSACAALSSQLARQGERGAALLQAMPKVREVRHVHQLTAESLQLLDRFVFPVLSSQQLPFPSQRLHSLFVSHASLSSLYVCPTCGAICPSPRDLLHHPQGAGSLCSSSSTHGQFLHHSVLWLLAKVSRHMAASCPSSRVAHSSAPLRAKEVDERPLSGVEDVGGPQLPRSIEQWLNSELIQSGLEDSYVTAPSASILPPLAVSATSSFAPSLNPSMPSSPKARSLTLAVQLHSMGPSPSLFSSGDGELSLMSLPPSAVLSHSSQPHAYPQHHPLSLSSSTLPSEFNKTSPTASASSSSAGPLPPSLTLYEKGEHDKVVDDLASKGSVTVEGPRSSITMSLSVATPLPLHSAAHTLRLGSEERLGVEKQSLFADKASDSQLHRRLQAVASEVAEPYEHARWLAELIYGDGDAGELDAALMASPSLLMFATKRRMVGKRAVEASRAVIACLLKHTNKVELALDEWSSHQDKRSHAWSGSLLKAWKQGGEVLTDMIAAHQQGMQYLCAHKGCDCEAQETHERDGREKWKCSAGHLQERCVERDTAPYHAMAERVIANSVFLLQLRPSLASSTSLQLQRLNSMRVRKILRVRPPLPNPSPEPSPVYEPTPRERQQRRSAERLQLRPQPQLSWSTTSAVAQQLIAPNVPLSPASAPLPSKAKTMDDGGIGEASSTSPEATTPEQPQQQQPQRVPRRASVGALPVQLDERLVQRVASGGAAQAGQQKREKLRAAVKRELQAQKWRELREELLLHRNSFVSLFARVPLSALVLSFAKDFSHSTSHLTEHLDLALRSAVVRAERRVKGLESLCLLLKHGGTGAKMLALVELHQVVREWTLEKEKGAGAGGGRGGGDGPTEQAAGVRERSAELSSSSFFPSASVSSSRSAVAPLALRPLSIHRFDNDLLTCGGARLSMISDAFYVLSGVNVNLMRQCVHMVLTTSTGTQSRREQGQESSGRVGDDDSFSLELIGSEQGASLRAANPAPPAQPPPPPSTSLSCSASLSLLLASLNCWQVAFHRSDFPFLRNTGLLSVIDLLVQSYPSLPLPTADGALLSLSELDLSRVQEIGRKSRSVFRLLLLACLTAEPPQLKRGGDEEDEGDKEESTLSLGGAVAGGGERKESGEDGGISVDSFESSLLNAAFERLECIHQRVEQRASSAGQPGDAGADGAATQQQPRAVGEESRGGAGRRRLAALGGRLLRSQLTAFTLPAAAQVEQDEVDCAELLSLLLLSCSSPRIRLSLTHSPADSTPPSPQLLSPFSSFSLPLSARCLYLLLKLTSSTSLVFLSPRCIRHTLRLCQQLLPLLTPSTVDSVFTHQLDSLSEDDGEADQPPPPSPFVQHLLTSIGFFTCGRFLERSTFASSAAHSQAAASELTALLRLLSCSSSWLAAISPAISSALRHLQHRQFLVTDDAARLAFYRGWGALSVLGGGSEEGRVGVRVQVQRVALRNDKLSKEPAEEVPERRMGTVVGYLHSQPLVVYDVDTAFTPTVVSSTQCTFLPVIPCLHPVHCGPFGSANLSAVVRYINQAFSSSSSSSVFALYPASLPSGDADVRLQQLNYVHSLQKVYAVRVLCYAISHALSTQTTLSSLLQHILRDTSASTAAPSSIASHSSSSSTLMSNLLSIAQNVIPLTQGVGQLSCLEEKQSLLHSLLHDRPLPSPVPAEMKALSIHVDLCHRALSLFGPSQLSSALSWLKGKHISLKLEESAAKRELQGEGLRGLQEMGFSTQLCQKALLLCNGDSQAAVNWLLEHGMAHMEDARNGVSSDSWGLEGVDFYQEVGSWTPEHLLEVEGEGGRTKTVSVEQLHCSTSAAGNRSSADAASMDPYRRLALRTGPRLKEQSAANERYRVEQRGLEGRTTAVCSLDEDDLRVGQLLRVNSAWVVSHIQAESSEERRVAAAVDEFRWFFLTEDNNWAPLDAKDAARLDVCLAQGISATWVGVEEKTPSLIRLDKMCMYHELTGHGRPLKRKKVDKQDSHTSSASQQAEPPIPSSLYSTLGAELQLKATELADLGFPLSHCARALLETQGNVETAANWIISNEQLLDAMDRETARQQVTREQWESRSREKASAASPSSSPSSAATGSADEAIELHAVYPHSGQLGVVQRLSGSRKQALLRFTHPDTAQSCSVWLPVAALEWDDSAITHRLPELNNRRFQGLAGLALDVASSEFILLARRTTLLLLYVLSSDTAAGSKAGRVELIKVHHKHTHSTHTTHLSPSPQPHERLTLAVLCARCVWCGQNLNASVFLRILKLASADPTALALPIHTPTWLSSALRSSSRAAADAAAAADPSLSLLTHAGTAASSASATGLTAPVDLWHVLHCILHHPVSIFATPVRDSLLHLLLDDLRAHLMVASSTVRDVDTEHPYQSSVSEKQEIRIDNAQHLLVTFDRRCNLNQAHACLAFYSDPECTRELAVFSGSSDEFSHLVVPGSRFSYHFTSGGLRQKPYEFGFRFRVRPIGWAHRDENGLLLACLGWPVLCMFADSPQLLDTLLSFHACSDLIQAMLRYLTVCRSPCKVLVTRALTALCVRVKQPMPAAMFEILLRVMEQLYESNTASGWGSSPFLMALVDLMRVRPTFKLTDSELWSVDSIDGRPPGWFFLTVLRAESLSRSLLHNTRLPNVRLVERAFHEMSDMEVLRWCLKQPELCLKLHKGQRATAHIPHSPAPAARPQPPRASAHPLHCAVLCCALCE